VFLAITPISIIRKIQAHRLVDLSQERILDVPGSSGDEGGVAGGFMKEFAIASHYFYFG